MNDQLKDCSICLIEAKNLFVTFDKDTPAQAGDLVGVQLSDEQVEVQKFKGQKHRGIVREFSDYFDQPERRDVTWKRVAASAELLPRMPKPKKTRAKRVYWPRLLAA